MLPDFFRHFFHKPRGNFHLFRVEIDDTDYENLTVTNTPKTDSLIHGGVAEGRSIHGHENPFTSG
jgi:hypothetical protein